MRLDLSSTHAGVSAFQDRRESGADRAIGRLVTLNGTQGVIACDMASDDVGQDWSVGHLISIVHEQARLVGVVTELTTADRRWSVSGGNVAYVTVELSG